MSIYEQIRSVLLSEGMITGIIALAYFLVWFILARWNLIVVPNRRLLKAQLEGVQACLPEGQLNGDLAKAQALLKEAESLAFRQKVNLADWFFWSRGQELAAWNLIHDAERLLLDMLPPPQVRVRLQMIAAELSTSTQPDTLELASMIKQALASVAPGDHDLLQQLLQETPTADKGNALKALLHEATRRIYRQRDTDYAQFMTMHHQVMWMTSVALLIGVLLAATIGNSLFLLVGAAGGVLSRLTRTLQNTQQVPTDYGAYWTSLFLSPVSGALAGWTGILMVIILADIGVLSTAFKAIQSAPSATPLALGIAFLLGFSERFFDQIASLLEQRAEKMTEAEQPKPAVIEASAPIGQLQPGIADALNDLKKLVSDLASRLERADAQGRELQLGGPTRGGGR